MIRGDQRSRNFKRGDKVGRWGQAEVNDWVGWGGRARFCAEVKYIVEDGYWVVCDKGKEGFADVVGRRTTPVSVMSIEIAQDKNGRRREGGKDRLKTRNNSCEEVRICWGGGDLKADDNEVGGGERLRGDFNTDKGSRRAFKGREAIES